MAYQNFKHIDPDAFHGKELTLHDCVADKISFKSNFLRFYFPDGFWITPHHKENYCEKTVRTDGASVAFSIGDIDDILVTVYLKKNGILFKKTTVETWNMEQLISAVNSGKCKIEFIAQYRSNFEQMWRCAILSNRRPYYRECQMHLPNTSATFYWDNLCPDREW